MVAVEKSVAPWYEKYIHRMAGVQGGYPVVKGTRIPVSTIVLKYIRVYPGDLHAIQRAYPHLTPTQIRAALAYSEHHRDVIDEDIRRHEEALEALKR